MQRTRIEWMMMRNREDLPCESEWEMMKVEEEWYCAIVDYHLLNMRYTQGSLLYPLKVPGKW